MRGARVECESGVYHVTARGVNQQAIFEDDADRDRFVSLLASTVAREGGLLAWCLMDNHVHLLVRMELQRLSREMRLLLSSYARYFNERYGRVGHLFQGRFSSEPVETDEYLLRAVRYIHLNPQVAGIELASTYQWSSYREYMGVSGICTTELVADLLGDAKGFAAFHSADDLPETPRHLIEPGEQRAFLSEQEAWTTAHEVLGEGDTQRVGTFKKSERDEILRDLKHRGLTNAQIQRITGVSRSIVARA